MCCVTTYESYTLSELSESGPWRVTVERMVKNGREEEMSEPCFFLVIGSGGKVILSVE